MTSARKSKSRKKASSKPSNTSKNASKPATKKVTKKATKKVAKKAAAKSKPTSKKRAAPPNPAIKIDDDVLEFIDAIDAYKQQHSRPFPSWSEVLFVLRDLGYRKR